MNEISENYRRLVDRIAEAALRSGREPESIRLIGVSKRVGVERIREAVEAGLTNIAENRVQEAEEKFTSISDLPVVRHFIGHLQSNKSKKALELFDWIQSFDNIELAKRAARLAIKPMPVLIQIKSGWESTKFGVDESRLDGLVAILRSSGNLDPKGLMVIPPFCANAEDARPYFSRVRTIAESYRFEEISMGMSNDFEVAIEEGSTMVRIGTALFGKRP